MARIPDDDGSPPLLTDQLDKVVALRSLGRNEVGRNEVGPYDVPLAEAMYGLGEATHPSEVTYVAELPLFHKVVARRVVAAAGEWTIGHLIRPGRSYQITGERFAPGEFEHLERRLARVLRYRAEQEVDA